MEFDFLPGQSYDCLQCAKGCSAQWRIHVDPYSQRQINEGGLALRVIQEHGPDFAPMYPDQDGSIILARRPDGSCVFLRDDHLCGVHAELGVESKPIGCRQFPFLIRPTPDGVVVGVSFFCTAVQKNHGRPLAEHLGEVQEIMKGIRFQSVGDEPVEILGGHTLDWAGYRELEAQLTAHVDEFGPELAIGQAIWGLCHYLVGREETGLLESGPLLKSLGEAPAGALEADSVIRSQAEFFCAAIIGMLEAGAPERTRAFTEALLEGEPVEVARFGWSGTGMEIEARLAELSRETFQSEIDRYLRALIHRKFLVQQRRLLDNLAIFYLFGRLLRFYTALASLARGAAVAELEDYYRALDVVEVDLATHTRGLDVLYAAFGESFYNQIAALHDRP